MDHVSRTLSVFREKEQIGRLDPPFDKKALLLDLGWVARLEERHNMMKTCPLVKIFG